MPKDVPSTTRFDVYSAVTDKIIAAIEAGAGTFTMPWHGSGIASGPPTNACTHCVYRGVNVLALWAQASLQGYRSRYWASYGQWKRIRGQVRRGERGSVIVFYKKLDSEPDESDPVLPTTRWLARASQVFNADQVDWDQRGNAPATSPAEIIRQAEELVTASGAIIRYGGDQACYRPAEDLIDLPDRSRFIATPTSTATEAFYATLFHELTHWTGASQRLDRDLSGRFGPEAYAAEELVAELGSAFLCSDLEIANEPRADHAAYVAHWLTMLRADKRAVFTAAQRAREAAQFLHRVPV